MKINEFDLIEIEVIRHIISHNTSGLSYDVLEKVLTILEKLRNAGTEEVEILECDTCAMERHCFSIKDALEDFEETRFRCPIEHIEMNK